MASISPRALKVGLILPHWTALPPRRAVLVATELPGDVPRWSDLLALARQAEAAGFDSLWLVDHLLIRCAAVDEQYGRPVPASAGGGRSCRRLGVLVAAGRARGRHRADRARARWSAAPATATRRCWRRWPTPSTRSAAAG